jgi:putative endonuclease
MRAASALVQREGLFLRRRVNRGERRAAWYYRRRGWRIVATNVRVGRNELDLIVRRGRRLVVVEVKEKTGDGFGDPLEMVDGEKLRRVRVTAQAWLAFQPQTPPLELGFDVVGVSPRGLQRVSLQPGDL